MTPKNQLYKSLNNFSTTGQSLDLQVSLDRVHQDQHNCHEGNPLKVTPRKHHQNTNYTLSLINFSTAGLIFDLKVLLDRVFKT